MKREPPLSYDYFTAFDRMQGFVSREELERLRAARVAIAGLGGTGGGQVHALARMGIGNFSLADPDTFELVNFNRQSGATIPNIGRSKAEVACETIHGINPEADVRLFKEGVSVDTLDSFLDGVDVVVDSLDFYCFEERLMLYGRAREKGIWVITAPPMGFGFTLLVFDPEGMRFEDYFGFKPGMTLRERLIAFLAGLHPEPFILRYLDRSRPDFAGRRLPSVAAAPFMIAGVVATEVTRVLLARGRPSAVPTVYQFDAYLQRFRKRTYRWGMRSPLQRFKRMMLDRLLPR